MTASRLLVCCCMLISSCTGGGKTAAVGAHAIPRFETCPDMSVSGSASALPLPHISIVTEGSAPITSKEEYVGAQMTITGEPGDTYSGALEIRGRGNSTWEMPKKPYKIKLSSKAALLGMPADKEWVLLANYSDKTLMRNDLAFDLSSRLGMAWTPRARFVELELNGRYDGVYQLTEQIKVAKNRVNVPEQKPEDTAAEKIAGGYLLEIDTRYDAEFCLTTSHDIPICVKSPDDINAEQQEYIRGYIEQVEGALFSGGYRDPASGYRKYVDTVSITNWFLLNELFKNTDAQSTSSIYFFKDRAGKLMMGPAWDFDLGAGNVNYKDSEFPEGWWVRNSTYFSRLFSDPAFAVQVRDRWCDIKPVILDSLLARADERAQQLADAQTRNFERWKILNIYVWPNPVVTGSYAGEVNCMKHWLQQRIDWMDAEFTKLHGACPVSA